MKYAEEGRFNAACEKAMQQIDIDRYTDALHKKGIQTIHKYGIACYKKSCRIVYQNG